MSIHLFQEMKFNHVAMLSNKSINRLFFTSSCFFGVQNLGQLDKIMVTEYGNHHRILSTSYKFQQWNLVSINNMLNASKILSVLFDIERDNYVVLFEVRYISNP